MTTFWDVSKKQLEECRAEARVKDRELEESEERHQTEVKVYKQKVKYLLFEQEHNLADLKAENMVKRTSILDLKVDFVPYISAHWVEQEKFYRGGLENLSLKFAYIDFHISKPNQLP